eukprot:scpid96461/ scgid5742/ 
MASLHIFCVQLMALLAVSAMANASDSCVFGTIQNGTRKCSCDGDFKGASCDQYTCWGKQLRIAPSRKQVDYIQAIATCKALDGNSGIWTLMPREFQSCAQVFLQKLGFGAESPVLADFVNSYGGGVLYNNGSFDPTGIATITLCILKKLYCRAPGGEFLVIRAFDGIRYNFYNSQFFCRSQQMEVLTPGVVECAIYRGAYGGIWTWVDTVPRKITYTTVTNPSITAPDVLCQRRVNYCPQLQI